MNRTSLYTRKILARYGFKKAFQFFAYAQLYSQAFAKWFDFVEAGTPFSSEATGDFTLRLAMRPGFRLVNPAFSPRDVVEALTSHYTILKKSFSASGLTQLMAGYKI